MGKFQSATVSNQQGRIRILMSGGGGGEHVRVASKTKEINKSGKTCSSPPAGRN